MGKGWHFITRLGIPGKRCTISSSGHKWMHAGYVQKHIRSVCVCTNILVSTHCGGAPGAKEAV